MDERYTRYIENLRRVRELSRPETSPTAGAAALLEQIRENAVESFARMKENNALLDEVLFSRRAEDLTVEEIDGLTEFAGKLFHYSSSEDCGIAFRIHALLLEHARLHEILLYKNSTLPLPDKPLRCHTVFRYPQNSRRFLI